MQEKRCILSIHKCRRKCSHEFAHSCSRYRWSRLGSPTNDCARLVGFAPSRAPVSQRIEQRFLKPQVACSIHAGGANEIRVKAFSDCVSYSDEYPAFHICSQGFVCQSCVANSPSNVIENYFLQMTMNSWVIVPRVTPLLLDGEFTAGMDLLLMTLS